MERPKQKSKIARSLWGDRDHETTYTMFQKVWLFCDRSIVTISFGAKLVVSQGAPKFRNWSTTLEIKNDSSTIGQKDRTVGCDIHKRSKETLPSGKPFVPNEDENTKYKKKLFLH